MFGNSLKLVKFVNFKKKLQTKTPKTSLHMFQKTALLDFQNYGFLIFKNVKKDFFRKWLKNPKFCEIQKNYNILKDVCWKRMLKTHVEYGNATFKKISLFNSNI